MKDRTRLLCLVAVCLLPLVCSAQPHTLEVIATFDYPSPLGELTYLTGISNTRATVGYFVMERAESFIRSASGSFSPPISVRPLNTFAFGINSSGLVCGFTIAATHAQTRHGFFLQRKVLTTYDAPGATQTELYAINDAGDFAGTYSVSDLAPSLGFTSIAGTVATIDVPAANVVFPRGINNENEVVGYYGTAENINSQGFFQDANRVVTAGLDYPGASQTTLTGINDRGMIVGYYYSGGELGSHGLLLESLTKFTTLDVPGATSTQINAINNAGLVAGTCSFPDDNSTGFIARIR